MKFSIITTAYNSEKYIAETIESVLSQKGDFELEYILTDGNSSDATLSIMKKYQERVKQGFYDGNQKSLEIKIISEADKGMYDGIAKGFKAAGGDIIAYINSDDIYLPNAFCTVNKIFTEIPDVKWLTARSNMYNCDGTGIDNWLPCKYNCDYIQKGAYGKYSLWIQQENMFYRRELLSHIDYDKFTTLKAAGDYYLWFTFSKYTELDIADAMISGFRINDNQKSENLSAYLIELDEVTGYSPNIIDIILFKLDKDYTKFKPNDILNLNPKIIRYSVSQKKWTRGKNKPLKKLIPILIHLLKTPFIIAGCVLSALIKKEN